jgi:peptidoglycan/LPS O-acetylase OafA/YrhL
LTGVFTDNPIPNYVNGSMWTLPYEFACYIGVVLLHFFFVLKNKYIFAAFFCASMIVRVVILTRTPDAVIFTRGRRTDYLKKKSFRNRKF